MTRNTDPSIYLVQVDPPYYVTSRQAAEKTGLPWIQIPPEPKGK